LTASDGQSQIGSVNAPAEGGAQFFQLLGHRVDLGEELFDKARRNAVGASSTSLAP
jgi:hypothetical protein